MIKRDSASVFMEILGQAQAVCSRIDWLRVGEVRGGGDEFYIFAN